MGGSMKKDDFEALGRGFGADGALGRIDTHTHTPHHANLTTKAASKSVLGAYYTDRLGKRRSVKNGPTLSNGPRGPKINLLV